MNDSKVLQYAKSELNKYLDILKVNADISLHLFSELNLNADVKDPKLDDAIAISIKNKKGYIAGINERSILIGVYRLLEAWGIVWLRPGKDGTYYPQICTQPDVEIFEIAQKRHRTVCIEGAVSLENVLDMVDWIPKVGFNGYYIQFEDAYAFFDRWYSHSKSTEKEPMHFDHDMAKVFVERIERAIKDRGLILMRMGHGWTCNPFGVVTSGWYTFKPDEIPQEYKDICALVNNKREVWLNRPLSTQLCYSNPYVQKTMVDAVVDYAKEHPQTDVIHFWLGDYFNNTCECPECTKYRFSDYQSAMINQITTRFIEENINAQVVFSTGYNKAHPPIHDNIIHQNKTILQFAPITRTYAKSFPDKYEIKEIPEYKINQYTLPHSVEELLAYLYNWKKQYSGDVLTFDYHLMWDQLIEASGEGIAQVIYDDIRNYDKLGINSFISCQLQRNTFPTPLAMIVLGKTLWNSNVDYDSIKQSVYSASFGEENLEKMCDYFSTIARGFYLGNIRSHDEWPRDKFKSSLTEAMTEMLKMISISKEKFNTETDACRKYSWLLVYHHAKIYSLLAKSIIKYLNGDKIASETLRQASVHTAWECEDEIQSAFDCYFYEVVTRLRINLDGAMSIDEDH